MTVKAKILPFREEAEFSRPFANAIAEWRHARAALAQSNVDENVRDESITAALAAVGDAEWKLLKTPAKGLFEIRERAVIVLEMFTTADMEGEPTDNRHRLMLAALISEIMNPINNA